MTPIWSSKIQQDLESAVYKYYRPDPDPEDEDTWDVSMVAEYAPEIFNHLRDVESKYMPNAYYIPRVQTDITWENRSTLINWIVQVHSRFNLLPETLYLTVNLIDRFLSKCAISLSKFQLCGAVALFIAAKYEEINCPTVKQMAYMVSNEYSTGELLKAEKFMITKLDFDMGFPGPMSFLRRTSKADNYDSEIRTLAKYFLEITIMDSRFVAAPPSWLAAGASYLSLKMLHQGKWTDAHAYYSGYSEEQLIPIAEVLAYNALRVVTRPSMVRIGVITSFKLTASRAMASHGQRLFSISSIRANKPSEDLSKVLHSELDFEKKDSFGLDETYKTYLQQSGFEIVNRDKKVLAELVKKNGLETIHVYFDVLRITQASYDLRQFQEEMQNQEDLMNSPEFEDLAFSDVNVVIEKNGKAVGFDLSLSLVNNDFAVTAITNFESSEVALSDSPEAANARDLAYSGPAFNNLADELQESIEQFLVSRGIDNQLGEFILAYASVKENTEYISWLKDMEDFFL
ncbi:hypothetical protein FOA43_000603 [Brettanomyces nanus]|uniref:Cyclin N-terminal domain-containing protein n=1 Tax=Eeniella nana TaxID=13502 RepID=A0A875RXL3_EENNA|nr:uncharacterized protein FOA43_000603 [Brettanomyces nanus]QPG73293.1 hypothetical protein FOA43_000603 [Brettanomyces nanus]